MLRHHHAKVSSHHFKNSKKIILGNLRNAREHCNSDVRTARTEDRISEKIDETIVRTEDRILEKIDETIVRTEDRASEKIDEIIVRVVISAVVGTGVAEVVVEGNRIYILVTQKT